VKRLALLLIVVLLASGAAFLALRHRTSRDGPVFAESGSSSSGLRLGLGAPVSFGYVLLQSRAKSPAKLESVRLLGVTAGLELIGIRSRLVPDEQGKGIFVGIVGYPPPDWSSQSLETQHEVPVAKTFFENGGPQEGLELVIGVRATQPGVARARGVEFTYKIGGRRYREVDNGSMYVCAPIENFTAETCPGDAKGKFDNASAEVKVP
jgi:hypothetical protein